MSSAGAASLGNEAPLIVTTLLAEPIIIMHKTESHFQDFAKKEENKKTQVLARWLPCARLRGIMVERDNGGGGLREGIMRYYLGRDYQVDLFTTRYPDDELGRLKKQRD